MQQNEILNYEEDDYLHVGALIIDYLRVLSFTWYILAALMLIGGVAGGLVGKFSYRPTYASTIYYSVDRNYSTADAGIAQTIVNATPTLVNTIDFVTEMEEEAGDILLPYYSIYASLMDGSNIFAVGIYCDNPEDTGVALEVFEKVYPRWVSRFTGSSISKYRDNVLSDGNPVNSWSKMKMLLLGTVGGGFIWFVMASILVFFSQKVHSDDDMYKVVSAEKIGILPNVKKNSKSSKADALLLTNKHTDPSYRRAMRMVREKVEQLLKEENKVFLITSTKTGEGKSILTCNLALALREKGYKVAVLDCDFYSGGATHIMECQDDIEGMSDHLTGKATKAKLVKTQGIYMIPCGTNGGNYRGSLNINVMRTIMSYLRKQFDVVLIDTPAVGNAYDSVQFSEFVDKVFFVIKGNDAEIRDIRKALVPFCQSHKLGGYILNRVDKGPWLEKHGYGYYGRYYNGYYSDYYKGNYDK